MKDGVLWSFVEMKVDKVGFQKMNVPASRSEDDKIVRWLEKRMRVVRNQRVWPAMR
jgi:hypothetical protein